MKFYLAEEDVGCGVDTLTGGGADGDLQEPAQLDHHPLHRAVVVQDLDEEAEEQDHRQYLRKKGDRQLSQRDGGLVTQLPTRLNSPIKSVIE